MIIRSRKTTVNFQNKGDLINDVDSAPSSVLDKTIVWNSVELVELRHRLLEWYQANQRDLPWRATHDPYAIWISEIMLQQTQVATVLPYYAKFMNRFPDVRSLAVADENELMSYWSGLGYYRRARQMKAAAESVVSKWDGLFPNTFEEVLSLPGIGRYTAGAICSFAFDQPTPIVEANTQRLYARLIALRTAPDTSAGQSKLWGFAESILPNPSVRGSRIINYATMELGALICKPKPDCKRCPLNEICPTNLEGLQNEIPTAKTKIKFVDRFEVALAIGSRESSPSSKYLLRKCAPGEWWTGLWDFLRLEVDHDLFESIARPLFDNWSSSECERERQASTSERLSRLVAERFGVDVVLKSALGPVIKHGVTKYRIQLRTFEARLRNEGECVAESTDNTKLLSTGESRWVDVSQLAAMPLSSSAKKIVERLKKLSNKDV